MGPWITTIFRKIEILRLDCQYVQRVCLARVKIISVRRWSDVKTLGRQLSHEAMTALYCQWRQLIWIVMNIEHADTVTVLTTFQQSHSCAGQCIKAASCCLFITCIRPSAVITVRLFHTSVLHFCYLQHSGSYTNTVTSFFVYFASSRI